MVIILCGKSGSGKDTIREQLLKQMALCPVVSVTSRPMRKGEVQGREYDFVSQEEFLQEAEEGKFLEYRSYQTAVNGISETWYYGTRKESLETNRDVIVIKDPKGAKEILNYCSQKEIPCLVYYLNVLDADRTVRAKRRPGYDEIEWNRRLEADNRDFSAEILKSLNAIVVSNYGTPAQTAKIIERDILDVKRKEASEILCVKNKQMGAFLEEIQQAVLDLEQTPKEWRRAIFSAEDPKEILRTVPLQMVQLKLKHAKTEDGAIKDGAAVVLFSGKIGFVIDANVTANTCSVLILDKNGRSIFTQNVICKAEIAQVLSGPDAPSLQTLFAEAAEKYIQEEREGCSYELC